VIVDISQTINASSMSVVLMMSAEVTSNASTTNAKSLIAVTANMLSTINVLAMNVARIVSVITIKIV